MEVLRVYIGSCWGKDYQNEHNAELFDSETTDLISDMILIKICKSIPSSRCKWSK